MLTRVLNLPVKKRKSDDASINPKRDEEEKSSKKTKTLPIQKKLSDVTLASVVEEKKSLYERFKQGDLIFGLQKERDKAGNILLTMGYQFIYAQNLNNPAINNLLTENQLASDIDAAHTHILAYHLLIQEYKSYLSKPNGKPLPSDTESESKVISSAYRRGCKLLLVNRSPYRVSNTHIVTETINWKRICTKWHNNAIDNAITGSEIRAVYRDFKKHGPNPHVFFYDKDLKLMDKYPWEDPEYSRHFKAYDKTIQIKKSWRK